MTKESIKEYFTNLGKSFYRSEEYQREESALRRGGPHRDADFAVWDRNSFLLHVGRPHPSPYQFGGGETTDFEVSGPDGLFWTKAGTRTEQGTEIKLWLKRDLEAFHDRRRCFDALREHFHYASLTMRLYPEDKRIDPFFHLAKSVVWPKYLTRSSTFQTAKGLRWTSRSIWSN